MQIPLYISYCQLEQASPFQLCHWESITIAWTNIKKTYINLFQSTILNGSIYIWQGWKYIIVWQGWKAPGWSSCDRNASYNVPLLFIVRIKNRIEDGLYLRILIVFLMFSYSHVCTFALSSFLSFSETLGLLACQVKKLMLGGLMTHVLFFRLLYSIFLDDLTSTKGFKTIVW